MSQPAAPATDSRPLFHRTHALSATARQKGRAGLSGRPAVSVPSSVSVPCLFLDRSGVEREVRLDCRPARFVRLEGLMRRIWIDQGQDDRGRVLYLERPPEKYVEASGAFRRGAIVDETL